MRERVAIVFMTLNVVATLALGGAIAYEFGHPGHATAFEPAAVGVAGESYASPATGSGTGTPSSALATGAPAPSGGSTPATPVASNEARTPTSPAASGGAKSSPAVKTSSGTKPSPGAKPSAGTKPSAGIGGSTATTPAQGGDQPAAPGAPITVGGIYDETGPVDATVERDTVRSYFNLVNAQGGVNGHKLQLIDCDSKYDPSSAHQCAQKLISEGALAIVGWLSLSGEQNETRYLTDQGVPIIGGLGVPAEYASPLSYPTTPSLVTAGTALGTHAGQMGLKKPGVIFLNANFIQPVKDSLLAAMSKQGITPVDVEQVDATKADYTDIVLKFQASGAQSVAAFVDPFSYARLFQAMERQNWHPPVLGGGLDKASANAPYNAGCGSSCAVFGADSATPELEYLDHQSTPAIAQYLNAVHTYYPGQFGALDAYTTYQWVAAQVFVQAIKNIGNAPVNRQNLVSALNGLKNYDNGGITPPISYGSGNHDPLHCFQWLHNTNGRWRTTSGWNCFG
ncbi:MAG TPA: ABC transporter substrate-binding protein [Gaiellaceae bacterium]|nr:ABC transporter substrate-binding protein [Gaiellaceae bacterium]